MKFEINVFQNSYVDAVLVNALFTKHFYLLFTIHMKNRKLFSK